MNIVYTGTFLARNDHTATLFGKAIYVLGGACCGGTDVPDTILKFDIDTNNWSNVPFTGTYTSRWLPTATLVGGFIYLIGGYRLTAGTFFSDILAFDIVKSKWKTIPYSGTFISRRGHTATLYNNAIYIVGGSGPAYLTDISKYDIGSSRRTKVGEMYGTGRWAHQVILDQFLLSGPIIYIIGGQSASTIFNDVVIYDITTAISTSIILSGQYEARGFLTATSISNIIYIIAGEASSTYYNDVKQLTITAPPLSPTSIPLSIPELPDIPYRLSNTFVWSQSDEIYMKADVYMNSYDDLYCIICAVSNAYFIENEFTLSVCKPDPNTQYVPLGALLIYNGMRGSSGGVFYTTTTVPLSVWTTIEVKRSSSGQWRMSINGQAQTVSRNVWAPVTLSLIHI